MQNNFVVLQRVFVSIKKNYLREIVLTPDIQVHLNKLECRGKVHLFH